eukprot:1819602-Pyramimonas_sp.AAC.1
MANNNATRTIALQLCERAVATTTCALYPRSPSIDNLPECQRIAREPIRSSSTATTHMQWIA